MNHAPPSGTALRWADLTSDIARVDVLAAAIRGSATDAAPFVADAAERLAARLAIESVLTADRTMALPRLIGSYLYEITARPDRACRAILAAADRSLASPTAIDWHRHIDGERYAAAWHDPLDRLVLSHAHLCAAHAAARQAADPERTREILGHATLVRHLATRLDASAVTDAVGEYLNPADLVSLTQTGEPDYATLLGRFVAARRTVMSGIADGHEPIEKKETLKE